MNKRLNIRLLLRVGVCLLVGFTVLHGLHLLQVNRLAANFREKGLLAEKDKDFSTSSKYLGRYLALRPDDREISTAYGVCLARLANNPGARRGAKTALTNALRRDPRNVTVRKELGLLAINMGNPGEAIGFLEPLRNSQEDQAELEETLAGCYLLIGETERAFLCYRHAIGAAPQRLSGYEKLARQLLLVNRRPEADAVLTDMVTNNPESATARLSRARFREQSSQLLDAEQDLEQARKLAPEDVDVLLESGNFLRRRGRLTQARAMLTHAVQLRKSDDPRPVLLLARTELDAGVDQVALSALRKVDHPQVIAFLAGLEVERGQLEECKRLSERLSDNQPWKEYVEACKAMQTGDWIKARRRLETLRGSLAKEVTWPEQIAFLLARCLAACDDLVGEQESLNSALNTDPAWRTVRMMQARNLVHLDRATEACQLWQKLMEEPGPPSAGWSGWARAVIERNLLSKARDDWFEVDSLLTKAEQAKGDPTEIVLLRTQVLTLQRKLDAARNTLTAALDRQPGQPELVAAMADLTALSGDYQGALWYLNGRSGLPERLARLRYLQHSGQRIKDVASVLRQIEKELVDLSAGDAARVLRGLTATYIARGDLRSASEASVSWCRVAPQELDAWRARLELSLAVGKGQDVAEVVTGLHRVEGDQGLRWRAVEAFRRLGAINAEGVDTKAVIAGIRRLLGDAETLSRTNRSGLGLLQLVEGRLEETLNDRDAATRFYLQAFENGERREGDVYRLVRLLAAKQPAEASRVLRQCETLGLIDSVSSLRPDDLVLFPLAQGAPRRLPPVLARLGAEVSLEQREFARAVSLATMAVSEESASHLDVLWLAGIYDQANQPGNAVSILERLVQRSPDLPDGWVALVHQLVRAGQREKAEDVVVKAQKQLSASDPLWQLPLARCYEALGKIALAERHYLLALKVSPDSPLVIRPLARFYLENDDPEKALPLLERLIHSPFSTRDDTTWARRMTASIPFIMRVIGRQLTETPSEQELLQLLGDGNSVTDRRIKALILASQTGKVREALAQFRQTISTQAPLSTLEQLRLAQLCDLADDRRQADELMKELLEPHRVTGQIIAAQIRRLISRGDNGEASYWLKQLRTREPDAARTRALQSLADQ